MKNKSILITKKDENNLTFSETSKFRSFVLVLEVNAKQTNTSA